MTKFPFYIPISPVFYYLSLDIKSYFPYTYPYSLIPYLISPFQLDDYCWLKSYSLYYGFIMPILLIIACNLVLFGYVTRNICRIIPVNTEDNPLGKVCLALSFIIFVKYLSIEFWKNKFYLWSGVQLFWYVLTTCIRQTVNQTMEF